LQNRRLGVRVPPPLPVLPFTMNVFSKIRIFALEIRDELKKASWPTGNELRDSTIIVIVASILLGIFTSISDFSLYQVVSLLTSWVG
ncbi:MAG: preprotein translocase subunit SecE, partial [Opitutaceae bacterium]